MGSGHHENLPGINTAPDQCNIARRAHWPNGIATRPAVSHALRRILSGPGAADASLKGYWRVDGLATWGTDFGDFRLGIANLLDEDYVTYYSQVYELAGSTPFFAGRGRSYTLSRPREF